MSEEKEKPQNDEKILREELFKKLSLSLENAINQTSGGGINIIAEEVFRGYGIKVSMQYEKNEKHKTPHIHIANGNGQSVSVSLCGEILAGKCDGKTMGKISEFLQRNKETLQEMWDVISSGVSIKPLKAKIEAIV